MNASYYSTSDHCLSFKVAMSDAGFPLKDVPLDDGNIHRFKTPDDKQGQTSGWYRLNSRPLPFGIFGCHRAGPPWHYWKGHQRESLSENQLEQQRQIIAHMADMKRKEHEKQYRNAAIKCQRVWTKATSVKHHPYLVYKQVNAYGLKVSGNRLLIPLRNSLGELTSIQFISPERNKGLVFKKRFLKGGQVMGSFHMIGAISHSIYITEGYATGATIHTVTGEAVVIAFNCNNLKSVALHIRHLYPNQNLIIAADNDRFTQGNPGITKGKIAANAAGAHLIFPKFPAGVSGTDFNDLALIQQG